MNASEREKREFEAKALRIALTTSALALTISMLPSEAAASEATQTALQADYEASGDGSQDSLDSIQIQNEAEPQGNADDAALKTQEDGAEESDAAAMQGDDPDDAAETEEDGTEDTGSQEKDISVQAQSTNAEEEDQATEPVTVEAAPDSELTGEYNYYDETDPTNPWVNTEGEKENCLTLDGVCNAIVEAIVEKINIVVSGFNWLDSLTSSGTVNVAGSGLLLVDQIDVGGLTLDNSGTAGIFYRQDDSSFVLLNPVSNPGLLDGSYTLPSGYEFVIGDGTALKLVASADVAPEMTDGQISAVVTESELNVSNGSTLTIQNGGSLIIDQAEDSEFFQTGAYPQGADYVSEANGTLNVEGTVNVEAGAQLDVNGELVVDQGGSLDIAENADVKVDGTITVGADGNIQCGDAIAGTGTIDVSATDGNSTIVVTDDVNVHLGSDAVVQDVALEDGNKLTFENGARITGTLSGSQYHVECPGNPPDPRGILQVGSIQDLEQLILEAGIVCSEDGIYRAVGAANQIVAVPVEEEGFYLMVGIQYKPIYADTGETLCTMDAFWEAFGDSFSAYDLSDKMPEDIKNAIEAGLANYWDSNTFHGAEYAVYYQEEENGPIKVRILSGDETFSKDEAYKVLRVEAICMQLLPISWAGGTTGTPDSITTGGGVLGGGIIHGGDSTAITVPSKPEQPAPEKPDDSKDPTPEDPDDKKDPDPEKPDDSKDPTPENPDDTKDPDPEKPDDSKDPAPEDPDDTKTPDPEKPDDTKDPSGQKSEDTSDELQDQSPQNHIVTVPAVDKNGGMTAKLSNEELKAQLTGAVDTVMFTGEMGSISLSKGTALSLADGFLEVRIESNGKGNYWLIARNKQGKIDQLGGRITVRIAYDLPEGRSAKDLSICLIDGEGKEHVLRCTYDEETGELVFVTDITGSFTVTGK